MKTEHFYRVSAIRQQARAGCSVLSLAQKFNLAITTVEQILECRTREAAARVLDEEDMFPLVSRFIQSGDKIYDFTGLIGRR